MNLVGTKVGDYQIELEIGRGGTSVVYRAIDLRDQKVVALKVMLAELINNEMALRRFLREGKAASRLHHSNIVQIYEAGQADGHHYIAMEFVNGGTLTEYVRKKGTLLPAEQTITILAQIGAALDHAHSQGIIHRDLKLSNILLTTDERVLLSDFGIAKHLFSEQTMITAMGRAIGTPSFMSPEQITGENEVDYRSDIYSLGVIAYVLFTGRTPFTADTAPQLMYKIAYDSPISPEIINPDVSPDIAFVLLKALSKEPGERYVSAHKFVTSLSTCQSYECEILYQQGPTSSAKVTNPIITKWPIFDKIPMEAFAGAMVSLLVLTIILSPSLSVTPRFLFAKLKEIDILHSMQLAIDSNRQLTANAPILSNIKTLPFTSGAQELRFPQVAKSLPEVATEVVKWDSLDMWMQNGYNTLVTLLKLEAASPNEDRVSDSQHNSTSISKPALPVISPKLLP